MKKLKENVDALQVGCQLCGGPHLDKECPLNKETKSVEEVKYGEFDRPFLNNSCINERLSGGVSGYGSRRRNDMKEPVPRGLPIKHPYVQHTPFPGCLKEQKVKDVEKLRQMITPTIHTLPNLKPVVQSYTPLSPFRDTAIVAREEEQDNDIPLQDGVMQPLTP
ncbi:hypothetical protein Tco_0498721 [Tanacetum coccineum]